MIAAILAVVKVLLAKDKSLLLSCKFFLGK